MNPRRALRVLADALAVAGRLQAFLAAHPGTELSHPDGMCQLYVPRGPDSITVTRGTAGEALDAAEEILDASPPGLPVEARGWAVVDDACRAYSEDKPELLHATGCHCLMAVRIARGSEDGGKRGRPRRQ